MSFINKSVGYSQIALLKQNILLPLLSSYNEHLLKNKSVNQSFNKDINTGSSFDYIIPNNNKKYYLLITKKSCLESSNSNYNILYFFPDNNEIKQNTQTLSTTTDFFLEINNQFDEEFLFEGYLYKRDDNNYEYLLTDILLKSGEIVNISYELRYVLLNEIVMSVTREKLKDLNNHMTINVHPIFNDQNQNLIKVFTNNFIYKDEIAYLERVNHFEKSRFVGITDKDDCEKYIEMGKYTDVYNVYNKSTNNFEGILYIKGIRESTQMKKLISKSKIDDKRIVLFCTFNRNFKKWQPVFD